MLRDARINQIGEGSNEVLTSFIALVGMRGPGMEFKEIYDTMFKPSRQGIGKAWTAGMNRLGAAVKIPSVPVKSESLRSQRGTARAFDLAIQSRGQPRADHISRTGDGHAADSGADCGRGNGNVRLRLRAQPLDSELQGVHQKWRVRTGKPSRGRTVPAPIVPPNPPVPRRADG